MAFIKKTIVTPQKIVEEKSEEKTVGVSCDLCGRKAGRLFDNTWHAGDGGVNWDDQSSYQFDVITIARTEGSSYPDNGSKEVTAYHACPECYESKVVALFEGKAPTVKESDW
jgi:hypothetical protein